MKALIVLIIGFMVVGCGNDRELEEKLIGTWEKKENNGKTYRFVFLEDGSWEVYVVQKTAGHMWSIKDEEVHMEYSDHSNVDIFIIEDSELKHIAALVEGNNEDTDGTLTRKEPPRKDLVESWKKVK